jgi:hypothetical protein
MPDVQIDEEKLYEHCLQTIHRAAPTAAIARGATVGLRIWKNESQPEQSARQAI